MSMIMTIDEVIAKMQQGEPKIAMQMLDAAQEKGRKDPMAGIFIAPLSIVPALVDDQYYQLSGARVLGISAGQPFVTPHYHLVGDEPYYFLDGIGEMNIGRLSESGDAVLWQTPKTILPGETFVIRPGDVHSFRNLGEEPANFVFACPESHLVTNGRDHPSGDRYLVSNLKYPRPPHYPQ